MFQPNLTIYFFKVLYFCIKLTNTVFNLSLNKDNIDKDPIAQFKTWFNDALVAKLAYHDAMSLATVSAEGKPSGRIVLLRGVDDRGFVFYTNYNSRKSKELEANPHASLTFFWLGLERQVRIEGRVSRVSLEESDAYFKSRPRGSQIGALASSQSEVLVSRDELEVKFASVTAAYEGKEIPRPSNWGGYRVKPVRIEFWDNRANRLHDRIVFNDREGGWKIDRLAP